jgi:hypothetical protein
MQDESNPPPIRIDSIRFCYVCQQSTLHTRTIYPHVELRRCQRCETCTEWAPEPYKKVILHPEKSRVNRTGDFDNFEHTNPRIYKEHIERQG